MPLEQRVGAGPEFLVRSLATGAKCYMLQRLSPLDPAVRELAAMALHAHAQEVRMERIEVLRRRISAGQYSVRAQDIAASMLERCAPASERMKCGRELS